MTLLSDDELNALRDIAVLGLITDVTIQDHSVVDIEGGTKDVWTPRSTPVKGWLHSQATPQMTVTGGVLSTVTTYRLYLEVGTDIKDGDRVTIKGEDFTVMDTTSASSWQALLTVTLRRVK